MIPSTNQTHEVLEALSLALPLRLPRLRQLYGDPTQQVVAFVASLPETERASRERPPAPYMAALCVLGELRTFGAIGCLLSCLEWRCEDVHRIVIRSVMTAGPSMIEPVIALWPVLGNYARSLAAEAMGEQGLRDGRVLELLAEWIAECPLLGALAIGNYGDPAGAPVLAKAFAGALANGDHLTTAEALAAMNSLGVTIAA